MSQRFTNKHNLSLSMAVFLADDRYDYDERTNVISVTTLLKSIRQIVLGSRLEAGESLTDISGLLASRLGTAIHESIEKAWVHNYEKSLEALGHPKRVINRLQVNPTEPVDEDSIPIWLELRTEKEVGKWIISGCADIILHGTVRDVKSTKVWAYMTGANDKKYQLQLSLYRWLNPDKIKEDTGYIEFLFTDHSSLKATIEKGYPELPILEYPVELLSPSETESFVKRKLQDIEHFFDKPESDLPLCSDEELWIRSSEWKYYAKPDAKRATKNFKEDKAGAYAHMASKGTGEVREVKGKAGACNYCNARETCSQYQTLLATDRI